MLPVFLRSSETLGWPDPGASFSSRHCLAEFQGTAYPFLPVPVPGASQPHNTPVFHLPLQPLQSLLLAHRPLSNLYVLGAPWGAILDPFSSLLLRLVSTAEMARVQTLEPDAWVQSLAPGASYFTFSVLGFHLETPISPPLVVS